MKNMTKAFYTLSALSILSLSSCSPQFVYPSSAYDTVQLPPSKVSVRNFDQMNETISALTEINMNRLPDIVATIEIKDDNGMVTSTFSKTGNVFSKPTGGGLRNELPSNNALGEFNSSHQGAIFRLASNYCDILVDEYRLADVTKVRPFPDGQAFPAASAGVTAMQAFKARLPGIIGAYYNKFWGACTTKPALSEVVREFNGDPEDASFKGLITDLNAGFGSTPGIGGTDQTAVANYLKLTCSVMLSTSCVTMF